MPFPYMLLYHRSAFDPSLEWATKYHFQSIGDMNDSVADQVADAEGIMCHSSITFNRWEGYDSLGHMFTSGTVVAGGAAGGEAMPIKYALLLRLQTAGSLGRPSVRWIHGWPEAWQSGGSLSLSGTTAIQDYNAAMVSVANYRDSSGLAVPSHLFRGFSRRKRMRRLIV